MHPDLNRFPQALSPLCLSPTAAHVDDPRARIVSAIDTLKRAAQALSVLYENSPDEEYGKSLLLETVYGAMEHAIALLQPVAQGGSGSDFKAALCQGQSWATRLAMLVDGHESTDDLEDDIDHVKAENPGLFSRADIAAAFQEKAERHARFLKESTDR